MSFDTQDPVELAATLSAVLLILSVWGGAVWLWALRRSSRKQEVEERLGLTEREPGSKRVLRLWHEGREVTTTVPGLDRRTSVWSSLDRLREEAGWDVPLASAVLGVVGLVALVFLVTLVLADSVLAGFGVAVISLMIIWTLVKQRASRRATLFERQLIDALELSARSLRAGHPLAGAFRLASEEIPAPVGTVFAEICQQEHLGVSFDGALRRVAATCSSRDMKLFATSVAIQLRSGGNLADMMDRLVAVMRDRIRLNRRARVLTAQTQFSKRVLIILPFAIFVLLNVFRPGYMEPLYTTPLGKLLLTIAAVSMVLGVWMMNRMAALKY